MNAIKSSLTVPRWWVPQLPIGFSRLVVHGGCARPRARFCGQRIFISLLGKVFLWLLVVGHERDVLTCFPPLFGLSVEGKKIRLPFSGLLTTSIRWWRFGFADSIPFPGSNLYTHMSRCCCCCCCHHLMARASLMSRSFTIG